MNPEFKNKKFFVTFMVTTILLCVGTRNSVAGEKLFLKAGNIELPPAFDHLRSLQSGRRNTEVFKHFIVQFENHVSETDRLTLTKQGLEILSYLPEDALIVQGSIEDVQIAAVKLPQLRAFAPYQPNWKLDPQINLPMPLSTEGLHSKSLVHVRTFSPTETEQVKLSVRSVPSALLKYASGRALLIEIDPSEINELAKLEGIEWIQSMPLMQLFDLSAPPSTPPAITGYESGTKLMGFEAAWERGFKGKGQRAAAADTGVDSGDLSTLHPDLKQVVKGYAMGPSNTAWADPMGHGTHVCGSVIGNGHASDGKIRGGAFEAEFIAEGMWNPMFGGLMVEPDFEVLMGTPYKEAGVRIHTNSWGSPLNPGAYDNFAAMADEVMWKHPDLLVLFAAGNDGKDLNKDGRIDEGSVASPGTAKNILSVGASENLIKEGGIQKTLCQLKDGLKKWGTEPLCSDHLSDNPDGLAAFSSRGPTKDGRIKPDIVAPGTNIVSVRSQNPQAGKLWGEYNKDYLYSGGTSMATPLTAGAATVTRQYLVDQLGFANPSGALVKATLVHTAKDLFPGQYGKGASQELQIPRPNAHEGYGRVDMDQLTQLGSETMAVDNTIGVSLGESATTVLALAQGEGLRVTLAYTDAPASTSSAKALVNDLDLELIGPSGKMTLNDHTNNVEMIEAASLPSGRYQIVVKGTNVPQGRNGKQPYALLISRTR